MLIVEKDTFEKEVLEEKGIVLVDFFGDGCVPCEALLPDIEALSEVYGKDIKFCKLNTSKARRLAIKLKVLGLPTIALFKDGEKIAEVTKDDATKANVEKMIKDNM